MKIQNAKAAGEAVRQQLSSVFVDGFYQWLKFFSKDKQKLSKAMAHMFNLDVFTIAWIDGQIAGMAALNDGTKPTVTVSKKEFQYHLGWLRGLIAYLVLKKEFCTKKYPFEMKTGMCSVEFVTTAASFRGKGVATAIIEHFFACSDFTEYVLEVADTNANAVGLYKKLGFHEFMRVEMKNKKQSGVNFLIYMSYKKSSE